MTDQTRRHLLAGAAATATIAVADAVSAQPAMDFIMQQTRPIVPAAPVRPAPAARATVPAPAPVTAQPLDGGRPFGFGIANNWEAMYAPVQDRFPIAGINISRIDPQFLRQEVAYIGGEPPGTIVVDPRARFLYHVQTGGRAMRYGVGVGREGFAWSGDATINSKQEWPDWYPPAEMIERQPEINRQVEQLRSGLGVPGGLRNPLGARALYLWQGGRDTLYRIHGTLEPYSIGRNVSSGCIRMINQDAMHLYERVPVGTRVVVLS